jgi:cytoskeleton protein RodZ
MHRPGESLRQEREARGKTIEEMAEATGIRLPFLTALEQEAFDSLPGRGFGKLYIRAYAEVLGFDPRPVIEAFDHAVRGGPAAAPTPAQASAPRPI